MVASCVLGQDSSRERGSRTQGRGLAKAGCLEASVTRHLMRRGHTQSTDAQTEARSMGSAVFSPRGSESSTSVGFQQGWCGHGEPSALKMQNRWETSLWPSPHQTCFFLLLAPSTFGCHPCVGHIVLVTTVTCGRFCITGCSSRLL